MLMIMIMIIVIIAFRNFRKVPKWVVAPGSCLVPLRVVSIRAAKHPGSRHWAASLYFA